MSKVLCTIRYVFISLEFLIIVISFAVNYFFPSFVLGICKMINTDINFIKIFYVAPVVLLGLTFKERDLFCLDEDEKYIIHKWDKFTELKIGYRVAIFYGFFSVVISSLAGLFTTPDSRIGLSVLIGGICISSVSYFSVFLARSEIKDIFRKFTTKSN